MRHTCAWSVTRDYNGQISPRMRGRTPRHDAAAISRARAPARRRYRARRFVLRSPVPISSIDRSIDRNRRPRRRVDCSRAEIAYHSRVPRPFAPFALQANRRERETRRSGETRANGERFIAGRGIPFRYFVRVSAIRRWCHDRPMNIHRSRYNDSHEARAHISRC